MIPLLHSQDWWERLTGGDHGAVAESTGALDVTGTWSAGPLGCRQWLGLNLRAGHFSGLAVVLVAEPAGLVGHGLVILRVEHASVVHQMEVGVG